MVLHQEWGIRPCFDEDPEKLAVNQQQQQQQCVSPNSVHLLPVLSNFLLYIAGYTAVVRLRLYAVGTWPEATNSKVSK